MAQAMQQANPTQINQILRQQLLATGIRQAQPLGATTLNIGANTRIKLQNIGVLTRVRLLFTFVYTVPATAALSQMGFLNAITNISLNDFTGTPRISASAIALAMRNALRERRKAYSHKPGAAGIGGSEIYGSSAITLPSTGLATGSNQTAQFIVDLPVCFDYDGGDLRGAIPMQSNVGEMYINIQTAATLGAANDDTKALNQVVTPVAASCNVDVLQEYILPQASAVAMQLTKQQFPIPLLDTNTVYELVTVQTSDNIAAGTEKLIPLPNTRMVNGLFYRFFNNSIQGGTATGNDISQHRLVVNGATALETYGLNNGNPLWKYIENRSTLGFDVAKGAYVWDFLGHPGSGRQPVQTSQLGNIQLGLTPQSNNGGNTFVEFTTESFYAIGTALGSIAPGA